MGSHLKYMDNWKSIRLELAQTKGFPGGSVSRGYLLRLPLNDEDVVDQASFEQKPHWATVRRYWSTEPDEAGIALPVPGGWALRCNGKPDRLLELDSRPIRLGQQIAVVEANGAALPFRVASVR